MPAKGTWRPQRPQQIQLLFCLLFRWQRTCQERLPEDQSSLYHRKAKITNGISLHRNTKNCAWASDCPLVRLISMPSKLVLFLSTNDRDRFNPWVDVQISCEYRQFCILVTCAKLQGRCACLTSFSTHELMKVSSPNAPVSRENPSDARTKSREIKARFWSSRNLNFKTWKSLSHLGGSNLVAVNLDDSWIWERQIGKSPSYSWVKIPYACNSTAKAKYETRHSDIPTTG